MLPFDEFELETGTFMSYKYNINIRKTIRIFHSTIKNGIENLCFGEKCRRLGAKLRQSRDWLVGKLNIDGPLMGEESHRYRHYRVQEIQASHSANYPIA